MEAMSYLPDISTLYRLPYSKNDNPNGWVEITTYCNLKCPGCYRGCDRDDNVTVHEALPDIQQNILAMKRLRNCQIISLSGGEPLMHPELDTIVRFIREHGMLPFVHTNGILLSAERIRELKRAGLAGLIIRVDSLSRKRSVTESDLNPLREKYGKMAASVKGIHLTFLCVVDSDNLPEIGSVINWSVAHARLVDFITFIPMRQVLFSEDEIPDNTKWVTVEDLCREAERAVNGIRYASFLGSRLQADGIKWLQASWVVQNGRIIGYCGPKFVETFQALHHLFRGRYAYKFGKDRSYLNVISILIISLFLKDFRKILKNFLRNAISDPLSLFRRCTVQLLCYIIPPGFVDGRRDECDGCPDAMLFEGNLVPSCGLEEYKRYGKPLEMPL